MTPKMMPTWLYHQDFTKFSLNRHYNGLGSNPREDMDVCNSIVPSGHGSTLYSRRVACPLMRLVVEVRVFSLKIGDHTKSFCHLNGAQGYDQR
ncbi:hypothetical protein TNCV_2255261 [Trichonephila clavipes]|nr:hypothetical protein TNCV_2255261 [Trichonephila clavipes]